MLSCRRGGSQLRAGEMGELKKRRVDSDCRNFQENWTDLYFFMQHKPTCLICKESVAVLKEDNIKRHYETNLKNKYGGILASSRTEKIAKLRQEIGGLTRIFSKKRQENEAAVIASYRVAHILSREVKPFSDGECVKKCLLAVVEELCPEKKNARRVEDIGKHLQSKLRDKAARFEMFSIVADGSTDSSDTAQLLVFIRGTNNDFELTEELAAMRGMHGNTTGEDLFKEVSAVIEGLALPWEKLVGVTTDGARSMVGCHSGLASRVIRKVVESNGTEPLRLHCIIHQQNLCGKVLNVDHVMKSVVSTVNFIRSQALNHRTF
ncbi:general transcription factor II-I repeat domain-containing protein 2A-like [Pomacea canaliculata]|uniref:general transcription factor II-I repeat domain-containing protein 2A-like n=1 Tax=Pomacea canaliculata TaxID=400727 RepID=UPI000D730A62|nr:general transcription factor II-I repeat domain-containing protein 2A-like [Pomacea canaliculata]